MKKHLLTIALALVAVVANAQDMNSKRGTPILPAAGDWSIGFNAVPFLDWAFDKTRIMSNSTPTSAGGALNYQINQTLVLQKMKTENTAMRLKIRFETRSNKEFNLVDKFGSTSSPIEKVEDSKVSKSRTFDFGYGSLTYRGSGRLKGFYGWEGMISLSDGGRTTYKYGNDFSTDNQTPLSTVSFGDSVATSAVGSRTLKEKSAGTYSLGVNGVVGVEYFFAPKMSVSCEYTWGAKYERTGKGMTTTESWDTGSASVQETESDNSRGDRNADILVGNGGGSINLKFYF